MRHQKKGKLLGRNSNERKNLIRGLITSLVLNNKIQTTETNGKLLKRAIDKMINDSKKNQDLCKQNLYKWVPNKKVLDNLIKNIIPSLGERKTGLTRIIRIGNRKGDNAEMVQVEWVTSEKIVKEINTSKDKEKKVKEKKNG